MKGIEIAPIILGKRFCVFEDLLELFYISSPAESCRKHDSNENNAVEHVNEPPNQQNGSEKRKKFFHEARPHQKVPDSEENDAAQQDVKHTITSTNGF